jgi:hypothetical protein
MSNKTLGVILIVFGVLVIIFALLAVFIGFPFFGLGIELKKILLALVGGIVVLIGVYIRTRVTSPNK